MIARELLYYAIVKSWRFIAANTLMQPVNRLMFDCSLRGMGIINYENFRVSGENYFVKKCVGKLLGNPPSPVLVDVGANVGNYSARFLNSFPNAQIFAIEPNYENFAKLSRNLEGQGNVSFINSAAGATNGTANLYDRLDLGGASSHGSLIEEVITDFHEQQSVKTSVPIATLDKIVDLRSIKSIDLLKIDTEGFELEVLKGAENTLSRNLVKIVQIEFNFTNLYSKVFLSDICQLLQSHKPFRLLPSSLIPLPESSIYREIFAFQNIVFIRNDLA